MTERMIPVAGIERLRIGVDGEGVRTLICVAGCPLRCRYCLNPYTWNGESEISLMTPDQLYEQVKEDNLYFLATGGGLTIGGGEPLMHMDALRELADCCPNEWSLWMETSLYGEETSVRRAAERCDHFIVDVKSTDPEVYRRYTGGDVRVVLRNLELLLGMVGPERITVRLPVIPGFADEASRNASGETLRKMGIVNLDHLTYFTA